MYIQQIFPNFFFISMSLGALPAPPAPSDAGLISMPAVLGVSKTDKNNLYNATNFDRFDAEPWMHPEASTVGD